MKNFRYKNFTRVVAIICFIAIIFSSCGGAIPDLKIAIQPKYSGDKFHKADASSYQVVSKSGLIEMLFNKDTATVAIRDTNSETFWSSLPEKSVKNEISSSAVKVILSNDNGDIYALNSQDNSVAFGNFSYTATDDGVSVSYALSLDKESGKIPVKDSDKNTIRADVTIFYALRDGSFYANVSMNKIALPDGVELQSITVLENFGAYGESGAEDYIFVPDGSGAIIKTGVEDKDFTPITLSVYEKNQALLGAFGIKRDNGAFLCIIENGDSIAQINANRKGEKNLNFVNASFNTFGEYKDEITLCYRFLSGKSATYSGMATACRENLIRNSVLSTKSVEITGEHIPLVLSLQGGYRNEKGKYIELSDYKQALSLATLLKAKGVNNLYLRYNGLYSNANNGNTDDFDDFKGSLGSKNDFNELYSYLNSQKFSLFIDTDILTYKDGIGGAKAFDGKKLNEKNPDSFPGTYKKQEFLQIGKLEDTIENILDKSEKVSFDGYALNDIGAYLYGDYSFNEYTRAQAKSELSAQIPVLATSKMLMIDTGNFYSLKNADVISNIPITPTAYTETDAYVGIPFVQMLLHGIYEYSTAGINTSDNTKTAFLNAIEYGCIPSVEWYCTAFDEKLDNKYYYDKNINDMVSYYTKADASLSELRDARMTSHEKIQEGVYCTEYDNSIKVYVNYTDKSVTVNGVIVDAMDCITIS